MTTRTRAVWRDVRRQITPLCWLYLIFDAVNAAVFLLYRLPWESYGYAAAVGLFFLLVAVIVSFVRTRRRADAWQQAVRAVLCGAAFPEPATLSEADALAAIDLLTRELDRVRTEAERERVDRTDYYTAWVHQIKIPIAVMKMKLDPASPVSEPLAAELFRIEQYVDMVLSYIRLESETNDLVIAAYAVDDMVRETVRKFAASFILRRLRLDYQPTDAVIVTDRKWFCVILEQFIANALKYTPSGTVTVAVADGRLTVADTGIGIAAEDLPRVFEKGYTGGNGRLGQKSSGLGLYLARRAADKLSLTLACESKVGEGSRFSICLSSKN